MKQVEWGLEAQTTIGKTTLLLAAGSGHPSTVDLLLEKGADLKAKDNQGWNALHIAASFGRDNVLQLLLAKQVEWDLETRLPDGRTGLLLAAVNGHSSTVDLLGKGADLGAKENQSWNIVHHAAGFG